VEVSIVIATHARPASLCRLLRSLQPQLIAGRHELFVAENGTSSPESLEGMFALPPAGAATAEVIHLHDTRPGKCRIQNSALARARGKFVVFLDDDVVVARDYLAAVEGFFARHSEYAAMKGRILPAEDPERKAGALAAYLDLPLVDHGDEVCEVRGVMGANMAFRRPVLDKVGPFDERLGPGAGGHEEETEMSGRIRAGGFRIGYAPNAPAWHEVDSERANRTRFIRVARERGYCRTLHEHHSRGEVALKVTIAAARLSFVRLIKASTYRLAREERRLAVARGMWSGLQRRR
jgi:GT2 family glycosyltransferase